MQSRSLPARPNLDHLKNEAKALHKMLRADDSSVRLTDAQRLLARQYGFPTWARLRAHVAAERSADGARERFLAALASQDLESMGDILRSTPELVERSLHVAAAVGDVDAVRRGIAADPAQIHLRAGEVSGDPLLYLCHSPLHGESAERDRGLFESARLLLEAGADPNTRDGHHDIPALYAVTGVRSVTRLARLLLDAGAVPSDGESLFHAAEHFHEDALELLLEYGADVNETGTWGNTPLYFLLGYWDFREHDSVRRGFDWLLRHGADPNIRCGPHQETCLHAAVRRAQGPEIIAKLLRYGADVHATRADGCSAWRLAMRNADAGIGELLQSAGALAETLSDGDRLLAACASGDVEQARRLGRSSARASLSIDDHRALSDALVRGRVEQVEACIAAGLDLDVANERGATALHEAAIVGNAAMTARLLAAGANHSLRDREHSSTALGWACFGADFVRNPAGDYVATVSALIAHGARLHADEHDPQDPNIRAIPGLIPRK